ncbi:MAG: TraB/GumN family protein, partial [Proteobacteria bacterium]|nr:TraB/GumN family protein [Pseudomonadota bacterium]
WKVSKGENNANYVFGTIHVSDPEVTTLPNVVDEALHESDQFVMEALPDAEQMLSLSQLMFFNDGRKLSEYIDKSIYNKTIEILSSYFLGSDSVSVMKPWAAFLMMNYPPDQGAALDLVLLSIAQQNGASVSGLESLKEQGDIFNELTIDEQVKLLTDTVCHYDVVRQDFEVLKEFYLKQDLGGLYNHTRRFSTIEEPVYKKLMKKLITDRNITMVKRMQPTLEKGKSFIAIGAMHLSGEDGVLALLEKQGYKVSVVY